jgi:exoribonuclease-2
MNVFFEESGDFKVGTILSSAGEAHQIELASGKRSKVKVKDVLLQFASPAPLDLMASAEQVAGELDLDFLWEVAGEEEFGFAELGTEYFGHAPLPFEAAGLILGLHRAPVYFYKKGRGRYKAAPQANLQAALAGIEKKKQQAILQQQYVDQLVAGQLPASMAAQALNLLFKPDKNSIEYKALDAACTQLHTSAARLMLKIGGIDSAKALHMSKFLLEHFPKGSGFAAHKVPAPPAGLPLAQVAAFSIDDVTTTEIDDAFSVVELDGGLLQVGIHIAAPGLGIARDDAFDVMARARMSTVYMPGDKITMLPDDLVQAYTLGEGMTRPALSLYAVLNRADWSLVSTTTRAELVPMVANLRHNSLEEIVTEEALNNATGDYPHKTEMLHLWQWAQVLEAGRMAKRAAFGLRPEQNNRVDFNFYVDDDVVSIVRRKRGAPLDKIVAELMIFANSTWGKLMHDHGVPGIYRTQGTGWGGKLQVRMVTHAAPHQGLGVDQYAWSTSPLRRYTDLVNQWQILACVQHGVTAPLVAPFKPRDANLFALVGGFDAAYGAYADFQSTMERYWCLRWLGQEQAAAKAQGVDNARQVEAVVLKDEVVRLAQIPLVLKLPGMQPLARGTHLKLDILAWDEVDLTVEARLAEVLQAEVLEADAAEDEAEEGDAEAGDAEAGAEGAEGAAGEGAAAEGAGVDADADTALAADADEGASGPPPLLPDQENALQPD